MIAGGSHPVVRTVHRALILIKTIFKEFNEKQTYLIDMNSNKVTKKASLALLSLFIGAAVWAQEGSTINYFVSPGAWQGADTNNTAVAESDYTKITSNGNKMYVNIYLPDFMASGAASEYKVSDINSFSITTRQAEGSTPVQNAYFNIYTQKGEGSTSTSWYESRLNSEPYYATNLDKYTGAGDWYTWSTEDKGDNAYLTIYDSSPNVGANGAGGFQGAYGVGATVDQLKGGEVSITRPSDTPFSKDYSQEKLNYISINVNDTKNNMSNPGLDIKSFNMNLAGQDYAWNFLGEGSTWNVTSGNQVAADKISGMTVNVSGEGTTLTTQAGLSNSVLNVTASGTANIDGAEYKNMSQTASWDNLSHYTEPLVYIDASSTVKFSNSTFENNSITHNGSLSSGVGTKGAIWVNGGNLEMSDSKISGTSSVTNPGDQSQWAQPNNPPNAQGGAILFNANGVTSTGIFSNVEFANNSATAMGVQGGAIAAFGGKFEFKDGTSFTGNKALALDGSTFSISGGALYMTDNWSGGTINVDISNATFADNIAQGKYANAGAMIYESYAEGSNLTVSDTTFSGNKAVAETRAEGGAMRLFTTSTSEQIVLNDVVFTNNGVEVASPEDMNRNGGGAIYANASDLVFNVSKDAAFTGNYVSVNGNNTDELGGFMRLASYGGENSSATFNVSEGATLTIGDGRAGYDSIASRDEKAIINKNGAGALTVNGSMEYFTGSLAVNQGEMTVTNKLGASSVSIAADSALRLTVGSEAVLTNENLSFSNDGTLILVARSETSAVSGKIAAASGLDFGNVKAYGATFDAASGTFASEYAMEVSYGDMSMTPMPGGGSMKFYDDTSSITIMTQGNTSYGENIRDDSIGADFFGVDLLAAWTVTYDSDDTVVLSFELDGDLSSASLYLQGDDGSWSKLDSWLDADTINTITGESGNFALVVPEPSTYALIFGALALVFVISRRRK